MEVDSPDQIQAKVEEIKRFFEFSVLEDAKFSGAVTLETLPFSSRYHSIYISVILHQQRLLFKSTAKMELKLVGMSGEECD